jgi:hypothetical protein
VQVKSLVLQVFPEQHISLLVPHPGNCVVATQVQLPVVVLQLVMVEVHEGE